MNDDQMYPIESSYPELDNLLGVYFDQDCEYLLDDHELQPSFKNMMTQYIKDSCGENHMLLYDIASWKLDHQNDSDPDASFMREFGNTFDPVLWGYKPMDFLNEIEKILKNNKVE